ncbi:hypothetical protein [Leuconostoc pseudomesenteroides]|uniref:hypothetical protein n=1 Tax=Leuconostoc pseudomesenteroides TaxID=33968 RepID=UPI0039E77663
MKQLDKIRLFGTTAILMIVIGDIVLSFYIKDFVGYLVISWLFNFVIAFVFHLSTKLSDSKAKHDKYKDWADKLNRG